MSGYCRCREIVVAAVVIGFTSATARANPVYTYSGQFNLRIPAESGATRGWMDDAVIDVPSHLLIADLNVSASLTHSHAFDLQLFLESPSGTCVLLNMYNPFQNYITGADYSGTTFDDEADTPIEAGLPPFLGSFRPLAGSALSAFDGEDAYGCWRFRVYDAYYNDTGQFNSFTLIFTIAEPTNGAIPEPATTTLSLIGAVMVGGSLLRRR